MNVSNNSKIIKASGIDYAIIDELSYYNSIYKTDQIHMNPVFYQIRSPFMLKSQALAVSQAVNATPKRIRKRSRLQLSQACSPSWLELCAQIASRLKQIVETNFGCFENVEYVQNDDFNNEQAKIAAQSVFDAWSAELSDQSKATLAISLDQGKWSTRSLSNECIIRKNIHSKPVRLRLGNIDFIVPFNSSFVLGDVSLAKEMLKGGLRFDIIVMDPPWNNKSVRRKRTYQTLDRYNLCSTLNEIPVGDLLDDYGLVVLWITNSNQVKIAANKLMQHYGLEAIANWYWVKVTKSGQPVSKFLPHHKVPFESLLISCKPKLSVQFKSIIRERFFLIGTPSSIHSRKPPISPLLESLNIFNGNRCLELFGRYLMPNTLTLGNEAIKLQYSGGFVDSF